MLSTGVVMVIGDQGLMMIIISNQLHQTLSQKLFCLRKKIQKIIAELTVHRPSTWMHKSSTLIMPLGFGLYFLVFIR